MSRLRLSEADRERFGCPEFLPVNINSITNREAVGLQKLGYPTPGLFGRALQKLADDTVDYAAWTALVWLALRRVGIEVDAATLEFDVVGLDILADEEPESPKVAPGKARARAASTNSVRKSSTRTATSKRRSTPTVSPS